LIDYPCDKFGDSFSHFDLSYRQTDGERQRERDADDRYTHAIPVDMRNGNNTDSIIKTKHFWVRINTTSNCRPAVITEQGVRRLWL